MVLWAVLYFSVCFKVNVCGWGTICLCSETDAETDPETDAESDSVGTTGENHLNQAFWQRNSTDLQLDLLSEPVAVLSVTPVHVRPYFSLKLKIKLLRQFFKHSFTPLTYRKTEKLAV